MEKLYRKKANGKYESIGYNTPDITDGIWLVQSSPDSTRMESLVWKIGDLKRPVDVTTHVAMYSLGDALTKYISNLADENSEEYKHVKSLLGNYLHGRIVVNNISPYDFASVILKFIATKIEENDKIK